MEEELDALIAAAVEKQLPEAPTPAQNPEVVLPDVPEDMPRGEYSTVQYSKSYSGAK